MARQYAAEQDGWALAKRGKQAKAIKVRETGDGIPVGTQRDLGVPYEPTTVAKTTFRVWVERLKSVSYGNNPPISVVLARNLDRLAAEDKTTESTRSRYKRMVAFFGPNVTAADVSHTLCQDYAKHAAAQGRLNAMSVWGDLNALRSALRWAYSSGLIDQPRHERCWNIAKPEGRTEQLTPDEFWRWYDAATSAHIRLFLLIALLTSQRHTAICELKWVHVDFERGFIDFEAGMRKKSGTSRSILSKGYQKNRAIVAMTDTLRAALVGAKAVAQTPYVIEYQGRRCARVTEGVVNARVAAGLPKWVTPHVLRHTAASWAAEKMDVEEVAYLTGHKDRRTLEGVYIHRRDGEKSRAAAEAVEAALGGRKLRVVK